MPQLRVVFISQWFAPEPTIVPDGIAHAVRTSGFDVEVLTGVPNYPSGRVARGYRAWRTSRELHGDLSLRRTPLFPSHDRSAGRRIANYLTWALSASIFGLSTLRRGEVNLVYGSPITAALPALLARAVWRRPFVLIVQDVWPDSVFATGFLRKASVARVANRLLTRFCNAVYLRSEKIVVISPGMKALLHERGVPERKIEVVFNWAQDTSGAEPTHGRSLRGELGIPPGDFVLLYGGNHGPAQGLSALIDGLSLHGRADCHLVMVGDGVEKESLERQADSRRQGRVHFLDPVHPDELAAYAREADAQVVSLADSPLFRVTVPSKLQSIMASGKPVLAVAEGDVRSVVEDAECGVVAQPLDPANIAKALSNLHGLGYADLKRMGQRARQYYDEHMTVAVGRARYAQVLHDAAERNERS